MGLIKVATTVKAGFCRDISGLVMPDLTWEYFLKVPTQNVGIPDIDINLPPVFSTHKDLVSMTGFVQVNSRCKLFAEAIYAITANKYEYLREHTILEIAKLGIPVRKVTHSSWVGVQF